MQSNLQRKLCRNFRIQNTELNYSEKIGPLPVPESKILKYIYVILNNNSKIVDNSFKHEVDFF